MTSTPATHNPPPRQQQVLELLVPALSFGVTILGILLWKQGFDLPFQYFSAGCIAGSCILAYLAWIRPHRDIVALTTPVYAFIFFLVPSDGVSWIVLQLLYAVSLTALLARLKLRFGGSAPLPGRGRGAGPLDTYVRTAGQLLPDVPGDLAHDAGTVFIRVAQGEYDRAARLARDHAGTPAGGAYGSALATAFGIVAAQAEDIRQGTGVPAAFARFSPGDAPVLFHAPDTSSDEGLVYARTLDNALLLLYATAASHAPAPRDTEVLAHHKFAEKLSGR
jgi:hypothetical protein